MLAQVFGSATRQKVGFLDFETFFWESLLGFSPAMIGEKTLVPQFMCAGGDPTPLYSAAEQLPLRLASLPVCYKVPRYVRCVTTSKRCTKRKLPLSSSQQAITSRPANSISKFPKKSPCPFPPPHRGASHHAIRRPQNHHRALLRPRRRLPPRNPLLRALLILLPAASGGNICDCAYPKLDLQPVRQPRRLCGELRRSSLGPGALLHRLPGCDGHGYVSPPEEQPPSIGSYCLCCCN